MATADATSGDLTLQILHALDKEDPILSAQAFPAATFTDVKAALDRLASRDMVKYDTLDREEAILEPEGEQIAANGSHEARVFDALRQAVEGLSVQELEKTIGDKNVAKLGQSKAFKEKWISRTKEGKFKTAVSIVALWRILGWLGVELALTRAADGFHKGCHPGAGPDHQDDAHTSRPKSHHRAQEAQAHQDAKGH